jgi:hypothetical protein
MSASAAGVCPAIHQRLTRRREVARMVGQAVAAALARLARVMRVRLPV